MTSFSFHTSTFSELGVPPDTSSSHGLSPIRDFKRLGTKRSFTIIFVHPRARSHDIEPTAFLNNCHDSYVVVCLTPKHFPVCTLIFRDPLSTHLPSPFSFFLCPRSSVAAATGTGLTIGLSREAECSLSRCFCFKYR